MTLKNRSVVKHGMLEDLKAYLQQSGWTIEEPVGEYEVLRARKKGYQRSLLVHDRTSGGCGYSIDERDMSVYKGWQKNRKQRGLDPYSYTREEWEAYWRKVNSNG